jgi:hypothetical protein
LAAFLPRLAACLVLVLALTQCGKGGNKAQPSPLPAPVPVPKVAFVAATGAGADAQCQVSLPVALDRPSGTVVTVAYRVVGGNAIVGMEGDPATDAILPAGTLTIPAGQTGGAIAMTVVERTKHESDKTVVVQLESPVNAVLGAPARYTYTITNDDPKAPVVTYTVSTPDRIYLYGTVPEGADIAALVVTDVSPDAVIDYEGTVSGDLFIVRLDRPTSGPSVDQTSFRLAFTDTQGNLGLSTQTINMSFGNGAGGTVTTGSADTLPPGVPKVELTITEKLTGDQKGKVDGKDANFTKETSVKVKVKVTAASPVATLSNIRLMCDDGRVPIVVSDSATGTSETEVTLATPTEGRFELTASATETNPSNQQSATGTTTSPTILFVDRTPPRLTYVLPKRYLPADMQKTNPTPVLPLRCSKTDDQDIVILNGADEAPAAGGGSDHKDNQYFRDKKHMNVFQKSSFTALAQVDDLTGISTMEGTTAKICSSNTSGQITVQLNTSVTASTSTTPQQIEISEFNNDAIKDSVKYHPSYAYEYHGRYVLKVKAQDRCGNALALDGDASTDADQFRVWVKTKAPEVAVGYLPPTYGQSYSQYDELTPLRFMSSDPDAAELWQDSLSEANRMSRLQALVTDNPPKSLITDIEAMAKSTTRSMWLLPRCVDLSTSYPSGTGTLVQAVARDFAGNTSEVQEYRVYRVPVLANDFPGWIPNVGDAWDNSYRGNGVVRDPADDHPTTFTVLIQDWSDWPMSVTSNFYDVSLGTVEGYRQVHAQIPDPDSSSVYSGKFSVETLTDLTKNPEDSTILGQYPLDSLDVGADGNNRRFQPAILIAPPSWKQGAPPNIDVLGQNHCLELVRKTVAPPAAPTNCYIGVNDTYVTAQAPAEKPKGLTGQLPLPRMIYPGFALVHYGCDTPDCDYDLSTGFRWANLIKLNPDVVATGNLVTVRIEAGFLGKGLTMDSFSATGDYVRFLKDSNDVTLTAGSAYTSATADQRKASIGIAGQRLIVEGWNQSLVQALELDLDIGGEVAAALYNVDVRCGEVKAYTDDLSAANKGSNFAGGDSWRMQKALRIINLEWVMPQDDTSNAQPVATRVLHATAPSPKVTIDGSPSVEVYDQTATLTFTGSVSDPIVDEEVGAGNGPLGSMTIYVDGQSTGTATVNVSDGTTGLWKPNTKTGTYTASVNLPMTEDIHIVSARTPANSAGVIGEARVVVDLRKVAVPGVGGAPVPPGGGGGSGDGTVLIVVNVEQVDAQSIRLWYGAVDPPTDALVLTLESGTTDHYQAVADGVTVLATVTLPPADPTVIGTANLRVQYALKGDAATTLVLDLTETAADSERYSGVKVIPGSVSGNGGGGGGGGGGGAAPQPVTTWVGRVLSTKGSTAGAWTPLAVRFKGIDDSAATIKIHGTTYQIVEKDGWKYAANGDKPAIIGAVSESGGNATVRMPGSGGATSVTVGAGEELTAMVRAWGQDGPQEPVYRQGLEEIDVGDPASPSLVNFAHISVVTPAIKLDHNATKVDMSTGVVHVVGQVLDPLDSVAHRSDLLVAVNGVLADIATSNLSGTDLTQAVPRRFTADVHLTQNLLLVQATAINALDGMASDILVVSSGEIGEDNPGSPRWSRAVRFNFGPASRNAALRAPGWKIYLAAGAGDNPPRKLVQVKPDARQSLVTDTIVVSRLGQNPDNDALAAAGQGESGKYLQVSSLDDDLWVIVEAPESDRGKWNPDPKLWEKTGTGWRRRIQQAGVEIKADDVPGAVLVDADADSSTTVGMRTRNLAGGPMPVLIEQVGASRVLSKDGPSLTAPTANSRLPGAAPTLAVDHDLTMPLTLGANRVIVEPMDADKGRGPTADLGVFAADQQFSYSPGNAVNWAAGAMPQRVGDARPVTTPPPPPTAIVPRGHVFIIELAPNIDITNDGLTRFLRRNGLEIVGSTRWDGDDASPGIHVTIWVRVTGDRAFAQGAWRQQAGSLIVGVSGDMDERRLMTDAALALWNHLNTRHDSRAEGRTWLTQYNALEYAVRLELAAAQDRTVREAIRDGSNSFKVLDLRYSDAGLGTVYRATTAREFANTRMHFTNANNHQLRDGAPRNGDGVARSYTWAGYDRSPRRNAELRPDDTRPDQSPRVFFNQQAVVTDTLVNDLRQAAGLVIVIHGFNLGQGRDGDETGVVHTDMANEDDPNQMMSAYWPVLETTLRSATISGSPVISANTRVLHVWWSGTVDQHASIAYSPWHYPTPAYFNLDMATAHFTGREKLGPYIQTLAQQVAAGRSASFPITLMAESLGNRVAVSAARYLEEGPASAFFAKTGPTPLRYVMIHPALRQIDITPSFANDNVEEQPPILGQRLHPYPESPLLSELGVLASDQGQEARTVAMYSSFDKMGLTFLVAQRDNPATAALDTDLPTPMLGRVGLSGATGAGALPNGGVAYHPGAGRANIAARMVGGTDINTTDINATDFWHVDLFGWHLPDAPFRSRNIFARNVSNAGTEANVSGGTFRATWFAKGVAETPSWHQIRIRPAAFPAAWSLPRQLIQEGHVPATP